MKIKILFTAFILGICVNVFAQKKWSETPKGTFNLVKNQSGQSLGYSPNSGVKILTINGLAL